MISKESMPCEKSRNKEHEKTRHNSQNTKHKKSNQVSTEHSIEKRQQQKQQQKQPSVVNQRRRRKNTQQNHNKTNLVSKEQDSVDTVVCDADLGLTTKMH